MYGVRQEACSPPAPCHARRVLTPLAKGAEEHPGDAVCLEPSWALPTVAPTAPSLVAPNPPRSTRGLSLPKDNSCALH